MLTVVTFFWAEKYPASYVAKLQAGIRRHLKQPHRFVTITDRPEGVIDGEFWHIPKEDYPLLPGCLARLRLFDPKGWQDTEEVQGRIVCIDLDVVITGPLDALFDRPEPFVILQGANSINPCPYNGSLWMLQAGYRPDVWTDFSLDVEFPHYTVPDDQSWFAHKLPNAAGWQAGPQSGVYAFKKTTWPKGDGLPPDARLVAFPGHRDPSQFTHLDWVRRNWRA